MNREAAIGGLLMVLTRHVGKEKAIGADALYRKVYGEAADHNNRKPLRQAIEYLRHEGAPIGSIQSPDGGGYYLIAAGSELEDYLARIRRRALKALSMEAKIRKVSLPELLGQMQLNLQRPAGSRQQKDDK